MRLKSLFEPRSPRYGFSFGLGLLAANVHKFWGFWGPFGAVCGHIVGLEGPRRHIGSTKSTFM